MRIEVLVDVKATLGEGPVWDVGQQRLYWIDSADGRILRCTDDGRELRAWDVGQKIGSMALRRGGESAIVALQNGVHTLDLNSGELALVARSGTARCPTTASRTARSTAKAALSSAPWTRWKTAPAPSFTAWTLT